MTPIYAIAVIALIPAILHFMGYGKECRDTLKEHRNKIIK
jgi:hypothetical protein